MKQSTRLLIIVAALFLVLFVAAPTLVQLTADWYWFSAVGFETVFLKSLTMQFLLGLVVAVIAFGFIYLNLRLAQRGVVPEPLIVTLSHRVPKMDITKALRRLSWPIALVFAFLFGISASGGWLALLAFLEQTPFGETDPVFGRDISYYVFSLPAVAFVLNHIRGLVVIALIVTVPLYLLRRDIVILKRRVSVEPAAAMHVGGLIALLLLTTAAGVFLISLPTLLFSRTGPLYGASYTDLAVRVPLYHITWIIAVVGAIVVLVGARTGRLARNTVWAVAGLIVIGGVFGGLVPAAVQRLVVIPNELVRETPQLRHHIDATRRAWGLDNVVVRDLRGESQLQLADIRRNSLTIKNVRLWDREPLLRTFGQLQEIRTYYDFVEVDDDRYYIDGEYRQVLLSPRELNTASLPTRTFINERLVFTHGMGLTLGPSNLVTQEGLPVLFIKDLPPASEVSIQVTRPAIYYGELSNEHAFVNTRQQEFDYPAGEGNVFTNYDGVGGVPISSLVRKLVLSVHFGSLKFLLSQDITPDSRAMYHRNILDRAAKALPFLIWDSDPYIVISDDGHLKWILDAYTRTTRYPYSEALATGTNYMRNSAKIVIDAYDGTIDAYIADPDDPIIQTYAKIFPGILQPLDSMPADLRAHIRYPEDLFRVQTSLYTTYHMSEPEIFYHREDQWQIPTADRGESIRDPFLRHIIMKLPGEEREEFIVMTPFTPRQKDNLSAWMVGRNDGEHYGELVVYRFPRQSLVFGPRQVLNRINQDTDISQQISLWDQRGSQVLRGNLLVIPIEESLIFVQAIYLQAEGGRIPELKRVVVAHENRVVMEETLDRGLARLFGGAVETDARPTTVLAGAAEVPTAPATPSLDIAELIDQATQHYDEALSAQRAGDWAKYGEEMRRVGELLRQLRDRAEGN